MSFNKDSGENKTGLIAKIKGLVGTREERRARFKKMKKRTKIIIAVALVAVIGGSVVISGALKKKDAGNNEINTAEATIGRVRSAISASGTIEPIDKYEVISLVQGDVLSDTFEVGDIVEKDSVLYEIDTTAMENTLERAKISMEKTQTSYQSSVDSVNDLNVKAPIAGVITEMYVSKGDSVSNGGKICEIIDKSKMILKIPFNTSDIGYIYEGAYADVTLQNSFYTTTGVVTRVSTGSLTNEYNVAVSYVDIEVVNPGGITSSDTATAVVNGVACNSAGTFDYCGKKTITAKVSGDVKTIYNDVGDTVYANSTILLLESESVNDAMKNSNLSLREAQLSLENTYDQLDDYTIKAPIGGTVIEKTVKAGDTIDNTTSKTTMCVIADLSVITFTINVDELDIEKIEVDQTVDITADALPNNKFSGHVNSININGTTSNGVTTYPVEIIVDNPDGLLPGMNVNAEIVIEEKSDILVVPVSAIMRGNTVYVKEGSPSASGSKTKTDNETPRGQKPQGEMIKDRGQQAEGAQGTMPQGNKASGNTTAPSGNAGQGSTARQNGGASRVGNIPEGFVAVQVETGINDDDYIEILSGLTEGDIVYVKSQSTTTTNPMMMMRNMGGMGGAPAGGPPSGGGNMGGPRN